MLQGVAGFFVNFTQADLAIFKLTISDCLDPP